MSDAAQTTPRPSLAERLHDVFGGDRANAHAGKLLEGDDGKKRWEEVREKPRRPSAALWAKHLSGERGLGLFAFRADGNTLWGHADVDDYEIGAAALTTKVKNLKLPVLVCKTKSGGARLLLFFAQPQPKEQVIALMELVCAAMKLPLKSAGGKTEILGGNVWMPYFGAEMRECCVKVGGLEMTVGEFAVAAAEKQQTTEKLTALRAQLLRLASPPVGGNPPRKSENKAETRARQAATLLGKLRERLERAQPGERHNELLKVGRDAGKLVGAGWIARERAQQELDGAVADWDDQPKTQATLRDALDHGAARPEEADALLDHGGAAQLPVIVRWREVVYGEDHVWFVVIEGSEDREVRLERIDDLTKYAKFSDQCAKQLRRMFDEVKQPAWKRMLVETDERIGEIATETASVELTVEGAFREHVEQFLTNRRRAQRKEDILDGMPWLDEGRYLFTMKMLHDHVVKWGMRNLKRHDCEVWIKRMGGDRVSVTPTTIAQGKSRRLWYVPETAVQPQHVPQLPAPKVEPM